MFYPKKKQIIKNRWSLCGFHGFDNSSALSDKVHELCKFESSVGFSAGWFGGSIGFHESGSWKSVFSTAFIVLVIEMSVSKGAKLFAGKTSSVVTGGHPHGSDSLLSFGLLGWVGTISISQYFLISTDIILPLIFSFSEECHNFWICCHCVVS